MFWLAVDVDELPVLGRTVRGFGHNRMALASIHDRDYGGDRKGSIRDKVLGVLVDAGHDIVCDRITLVTIPRVAHYVFNPVSFYLCFGSDSRLLALVCEVRNTFAEMHHYVAVPGSDNDAATSRFSIPKRFHVSPFLEVSGTYDVRLRTGDDSFAVVIQLQEAGRPVLTASMVGAGKPMTTATLQRTLIGAPFFAATIMLRIHLQALVLVFRKRVPVFAKPVPSDPATTPAGRQSIWVCLRARALRLASRGRDRSWSQLKTPFNGDL